MTAAPIERTVRYATSVSAIEDAWAFVMAHMDQVGARPAIQIHPYQVLDDDGQPGQRWDVAVSGMTEEAP